MNRDARTCAEWVRDHVWAVPELVYAAARRFLGEDPAPEKLLPAAVAHHEEFRGQQDRAAAARHRRLVAQALERDGYLCQLCPETMPDLARRATPYDPLDAHHLEGGHGKRRQQERLENLITAHRSCHDAYHDRPSAFVERVKRWCDRNRYPYPRRKEYRP